MARAPACAREGLHDRAVCGCADSILGRCGFQFLKFLFHLIARLTASLRGGTEAIVP
jgi:hypothetical protein